MGCGIGEHHWRVDDEFRAVSGLVADTAGSTVAVEQDLGHGRACSGVASSGMDPSDELVGERLGAAPDEAATVGQEAALIGYEGEPPHGVGVIGVVHHVRCNSDLEGLIGAEVAIQDGRHA